MNRFGGYSLGKLWKNIVRKKHLEITLSKLKISPKLKCELEQYPISPDAAAEVLFIASQIYNDIRNRKIIDLGCGSGFLAIGAAILGAKEVVGVDLDLNAIKTARINAEAINVKDKIQWVIGDVSSIIGKFDVVLQNPPFGVKKRGADILFLKKALEIGKVIYTLHKSSEKNRKFIKDKIINEGGEVSAIFQINLTIPRLFNFHYKKRHIIKVDLYRVVKNDG
ncbi:50S ribosomal protein L11 methyltransferase [Candidatus Bathyarchaeota archaeon]|nr:50S ribosomal protein L11 methyltransferase [Candidatus Bathyarchaeota archaeon]